MEEREKEKEKSETKLLNHLKKHRSRVEVLGLEHATESEIRLRR